MKKRTSRFARLIAIIMLPSVTGACTQHELTPFQDVIANQQPETIRVRTRIPGDYGPGFPDSRRKIFHEREIEMPEVVGDTLFGSHNGRLVKIPLDRVAKVSVPKVASVSVLKEEIDPRLKEVSWADRFFGELFAEILVCTLSYGALC